MKKEAMQQAMQAQKRNRGHERTLEAMQLAQQKFQQEITRV